MTVTITHDANGRIRATCREHVALAGTVSDALVELAFSMQGESLDLDAEDDQYLQPEPDGD